MDSVEGMDSTYAWPRDQFHPTGCYLNTATAGLPTQDTWDALQGALTDWRSGTAHAPDYDEPLERSRRTFASLVGVDPGLVAVGSQASVFVGLVAASVPDGAEVLVAGNEFTSVTFPFFAHERRGVVVREVELDTIADHITDQTALVAVAAVQSADGRLADLDAIETAARRHDAQTLIDTTQAIGWLPVNASRFDFTVTSGYKWLLAPRGTAFFTVAPDHLDALIPAQAGWYAGQNPWTSIYGGPLRLADTAKRFDVSPAWHSWVGAAPGLDLLATVGRTALHEHAVGLARDFCDQVGLPPSDSAILSLTVDEDTPQALADAQITAASRDGRLRVSFHISNTAADVRTAAAALAEHLVR